MTRRRMVSNLKTLLLVILVFFSFVLSDKLWMGMWGGTTSEVGTEVLPMSASRTPTPAQLNTPMQMLVHDLSRNRDTLLNPGSSPFTADYKLLQTAHITGFRELGDVRYQNTLTYQFGYSLSRDALVQIIPDLKSYNFGGDTSQLILNDDPWTGIVSLIIPEFAGSDWFTTDISQSAFGQALSQAAERPAWVTPQGATDSYVPSTSITMDESVWTVKQPVQLSLVRSFFVNPLALTSLTGSGTGNVWTDGSRIVWWNQPKAELTYEDPNVTSAASPSIPSMDVAINFIRAHGGSPDNAVAVTQAVSPGTQYINSFTMRPYIGGYPIVDGSADYQVQFEFGQITHYVRPIWELTGRVSQKPVRVMGITELNTVMNHLSPGFTWAQLSVQLGYETVAVGNGVVRFEPVYVITSDGLTIWTLSAVTGRPVKGLDAS